jgi:transcriptional regulator GlxA family with amidase domain
MARSGKLTVGVLVFEGVKLLDAVGPAEVFAEANQTSGKYRLWFVSPDGSDVMTSVGTRLAAHSDAEGAPALDVLIIPGSELPPPVFVTAEVLSAAGLLVERTERVTSVCTGAFVLAELGLLDGRRATTHWRYVATLSARFPRVLVEPDSIFVRDGDLYTSAGVAAGIDLGLALVEDDLGADAARAVAQSLLVYMQRAGGQSQFSAALRGPLPHAPLVRQVVDWIKADPAGVHTAEVLARRAGVSPRHLSRLFREDLDSTPAQYVATIRLDAAKAFLDRGYPVGQTAERSGFGSTEALRRAFTARLGISPQKYQRRFRSTKARSHSEQ